MIGVAEYKWWHSSLTTQCKVTYRAKQVRTLAEAISSAFLAPEEGIQKLKWEGN